MARHSKPSNPAVRPPGIPPLEQVVEDLTVEVQKLTDQVEVLRIAIDDLQCEVEWGIRQIAHGAWLPTPGLPSTPAVVGAGDADDDVADASGEVESPLATPAPPPSTCAEQRGLWD